MLVFGASLPPAIVNCKLVYAEISHLPVATTRPVASRDKPSQNMSCCWTTQSQYFLVLLHCKKTTRKALEFVSKIDEFDHHRGISSEFKKACTMRFDETEISHTSVFETLRWETIPEVKLYVAVSVFLPALPEKVLAAHDDHTSTFPVL